MGIADRLIGELTEKRGSSANIALPRAYQAQAGYQGGLLRALGNYVRERTLGSYLSLIGLGATALGGVSLPGCGGGNTPNGPTNDCRTAGCPTGQQCAQESGEYICRVPQPPQTGSLRITTPEANSKPATPLDVRYTFSDQSGRATHADFTVDGGEIYHDRSMDGEFQIPEKKLDGSDSIGPGSHRLAGYLADNSEAKLDGSDASANFDVIGVSGTVRDRIAGGSVNSSTITWRGPVTKSTTANGSYSIAGLAPGDYEVTITQNGVHVEHKNLKVTVGGTGSYPFSVLRFGSGRFGAFYDSMFDGFYQKFARPGIGIKKWSPPTSIPQGMYITLDGLSEAATEEFKILLNEVNNESTPDMFCGGIGPLPISYGPSIGNFRNNIITGAFTNGSDQGVIYDFTTADQIIKSARIGFWLDLLDDSVGDVTTRERKKNHVAHEMMHAINGSQHAFNTYRDSLQGGFTDVTRPSKEDKLASCIMLDKDTHPGNRAPDTNPTYIVGPNGSFNLRR